MKNILYATDYSENSVSALRLAHSFAKKFAAKLVVIHVFDVPVSLASPVTISYMNKEKRLFVENRVKLKAFCAEHLDGTALPKDINFLVVEYGSIADGILEKAAKLNVDLIVVGTKGNSPLRELLLGSTTKALIKKAPCPVLAVPKIAKIDTLSTIVYATAFERADIFAIAKLVKIANTFNAQIRVVHITTQKEYAGAEQMEWFKDMLGEKVKYANIVFDLIFSDTVYEDLLSYLEDVEANLVTMLERKDSTFYQRYLEGDLVLKMEQNTAIPLLTYAAANL